MTSDVSTLKIAIFSDLHLVPEGEASNTLESTARLHQGIAHFNARHADADLCILAGDLADLAEPAAYARLEAALPAFAVPPQLMLGNHDSRPAFLAHFGQSHADENGFVQKVIDIKGHRVILLDSTEPGLVAGRLCAQRLSWLGDRLDEALDRPVIVVLHHHVVPLHTAVDRIILQDAAALAETLSRHPDVRQVISGHVHLTSSSSWKGVNYTTLAGGHYSVSLQIEGGPVPSDNLEGPGQYALVLSGPETTVVHFEDYFNRHAVIAKENFWRLRPEKRPVLL